MNATMRDEDKLRNPLCVRWTTQPTAAWQARISASEMVRRLVSQGLQAGNHKPAGATQ